MARMAVIATATLSLGACSLSTQMASLDKKPSDLMTSSVAKSAKAEGIDSTDAELIKQAVVGADPGAAGDHSLAWSNPDTGNSGTIMAIDRFIGKEGQNCKKFQTTVDSFMGISIYKGETCELRKNQWVLSDFLRDKK